MLPSPAELHLQQDFIRLSGPRDGGWRQRPGGGPAGRGLRTGPAAGPQYPPRRPAAHWDHRRPPDRWERDQRPADRWERDQRPADRWHQRRPAAPLGRPAEPSAPAGCPWMRPGKKYSRGVVGLHEEIEDFFQHMSPTVDEHHLRSTVFENIRNVILGLWREAQVFIFGSFETGLYLPTSDIDVVVIGKWRGPPLEMLKDALIAANVCDFDSVKVLDKAAVPIIKFTDRRSQIKVDISFNMSNGLVSANRIKQLTAEFPHLPRLVMVLKQFLLQRELNEVFTGGISSYGVILMVVSFLQTHERQLGVFPGCNLGVLLLEFFELYSVKFNYHNTCIRVSDGGYAPRREVEGQFVGQSAHSSPLCIEDPHNPTNDIGRSSYHVMKVKEAFRYAYHRLRFSVLATGRDGDPNRGSILGRIVTVPDEVEDFRRWIAANFPSPEPAGVETSGPQCEEEEEEEEVEEVEEEVDEVDEVVEEVVVEEVEVEEEVEEEDLAAMADPELYSSSAGLEPHDSSAGLESQASSGGFEPHNSSGGFEPHDSSGGFEPHDSSGGFEPHDSSVGFEPHDGSAGLESQGSSGGLEPHGISLEPQDIEQVDTQCSSSPAVEINGFTFRPAPAPAASQQGKRAAEDQPVWWTDACRLALKVKKRAQRLYRKRQTQESLITFKKATAESRRINREAKVVAGVGYRWEEHEEEEVGEGEPITPSR